jgi:hypothetical protein
VGRPDRTVQRVPRARSLGRVGACWARLCIRSLRETSALGAGSLGLVTAMLLGFAGPLVGRPGRATQWEERFERRRGLAPLEVTVLTDHALLWSRTALSAEWQSGRRPLTDPLQRGKPGVDAVPDWETISRLLTQPMCSGASFRDLTVTSGWPWRSHLGSVRGFGANLDPAEAWVLPARGPRPGDLLSQRLIPMRVRPLPLIGNAAALASLFAAARAAMIASRGVARHAKGRCWRCGYPRPSVPSIAPCAECGSTPA